MRQYRGFTKDGELVHGWYVGDGYKCGRIIPTTGGYGSYGSTDEYKTMIGPVIEVIPESVGQSTGLKDKNGKGDEVYEHDIIDNEWVVRFYDGHFVLCNPINEPVEQCALEVFDALSIKKSEITGNIHQNKNLLEKSK